MKAFKDRINRESRYTILQARFSNTNNKCKINLSLSLRPKVSLSFKFAINL